MWGEVRNSAGAFVSYNKWLWFWLSTVGSIASQEEAIKGSNKTSIWPQPTCAGISSDSGGSSNGSGTRA